MQYFIGGVQLAKSVDRILIDILQIIAVVVLLIRLNK